MVARLTIFLPAVMLAVIATAGPAAGHAELVRTSPSQGERLAESPSELVLVFSEAVTPVSGGFRLLRADGALVQEPAVRTEGSRVIATVDGVLPDGGYLLSWAVVSSDSHPVSGVLRFGVGAQAPDDAGSAEPQVDRTMSRLLEALAFLVYAGIALLCGAALFSAYCLARPSEVPAVISRLGRAGGAVVAIASIAGAWLFGPYAAGQGFLSAGTTRYWSLAMDTGVAPWMLLAAALAAVGVVGFGWLAQHGVAAGLFTIAMGLSQAMTGHASAMSDRALAVASYTAHVAAMAAWVGGVAVLVVLLSLRHPALTPAGVRRFSAIALGGVAVLVLTGSLQAWWILGSVSQLWTTTYGRLLVAKIALVLLIVVIAVFSRRWARDGELDRLAVTVRGEGFLQVGVLALTAVIVMSSPPASVPQAPEQVRVEAALPSGQTVEATITPASTGPNRVSVVVLDADGGATRVQAVEAAMTLPEESLGPIEVQLHGHTPGRFTGSVALPTGGNWQLDMTVRLTALDSYAVTAPVTVAP
jgi:copper transport protein